MKHYYNTCERKGPEKYKEKRCALRNVSNGNGNIISYLIKEVFEYKLGLRWTYSCITLL